MLAHALAVVEAVRKLDLVSVASVPGMRKIGCEPRRLPQVLRELGLAVEQFDAASGRPRDPAALLLKAVRFAAERGIPPEEMVAAISENNADEDMRDAEAIADLRPQPGELGPPDGVSDSSPVPAPAPRPEFGGPDMADKYESPEPSELPEQLRPATGPAPKSAPSNALAPVQMVGRAAAGGILLQQFRAELGYESSNVLAEAGDYAADAGMEADAIGDRLEYAVARFGWTPKLRALAAAYHKAMNQASVDDVSSTPMISMESAGILSRVSANLREIELNPSTAYEAEENGWKPPVPRR